MVLKEDGHSFSSVSCIAVAVTDSNDPEDVEADSLVGELYKMSGELLSKVPVQNEERTDNMILTIDGNPVRIEVLKQSGKLQLTSLVSTDNKDESIKNARVAHKNKIKELEETLTRITVEKLKAEEQCTSALAVGADSEEEEDASEGNDGTRGQDHQAVVTELLKAMAKEKKSYSQVGETKRHGEP
mmetsp:Transcript_22157/g.28671  ORF Transcript_22157/g.28671 Transcript_22157/m.28671 type:complete len:186 (-) Transcript_22157:82-639(-)